MGIFIAPSAINELSLPQRNIGGSIASKGLRRTRTLPKINLDNIIEPSGFGLAKGAQRVPRKTAIAQSEQLKVYWTRLIFAAVFLLIILIGGFVAAVLKINEWSTLLLHSFELLLGIFVGLLGGDIAAKKNG